MSRRPKTPRVPAGMYLLAGLALFAIVVVAVLVRAPAAPPTATAPVPHFVDTNEVGSRPKNMRTLVVGQPDEQLPGLSGTGGVLLATLKEGALPSTPTEAMVLTDANCEPDAQGVSHCLNDLSIGGTRVTVQHHHAMSEIPCLTPGETVRLETLALYHATASNESNKE